MGGGVVVAILDMEKDLHRNQYCLQGLVGLVVNR